MEFEWDNDKSNRNLAERGFGFDFAALIFDGLVAEQEDRRKDYGEVRMIALGEVDGLILRVVYTDRGDVRRIISAHIADRKDRSKWQSFTKP